MPFLFGAVEVGHVGEDEAAVVGGVFAEGELAVDFEIVDGGEVAVLGDEAAGAGVELLDVGGRPPVAEVALAVELAALVVEAVGELVADDGADVAVVDGVILFGVVEGGLEDASGEVDVVHAGVVVGVDGGRGHAPLAAVDGLADFGKLAVVFKGVGPLEIAGGVVWLDGEGGVVAPLVGVADLIGDGGEFFLGADLGGGAHPGNGVDVGVHGVLDVVDHFEHFGLAVAGEVLGDVDLAEGLAECAVGGDGAAFPAGALGGDAVELAAVEVEVFRRRRAAGAGWRRCAGGGSACRP